MRLFSGAAAVLTVAALLIAEETRAQSPVDFAWGDVFASEPTSLDEQLSGALQAPAGRDLADCVLEQEGRLRPVVQSIR